MSLPRFYAPDFSAAGSITLTDAEAHHLLHVVRLHVGDEFEVCNGRGGVGRAVIRKTGRHEVQCDASTYQHEPPAVPEIVLATAVPKGDRFDWLVEKATELGVTRLVPLQTARSTVDPRDSKLERLRQTVIAACKQCRRPWLMELSPVCSWQEFLDGIGNHPLLLAEPGGRPLSTLTDSLREANRLVFAVGPEGGFTAEEISSATASVNVHKVDLGANILRIETAGMLLAGWGMLLSSPTRPE